MAKKTETIAISDETKQKMLPLIQNFNGAKMVLDTFIEGVAQGLAIKGRWVFSYDNLCFSREVEEPCQDTEKLPPTEASTTNKN